MSGRNRTIALQATGVAILAAVVYLAFLRPSTPDPLSKIVQAPAERQVNHPSFTPSDRFVKPKHGLHGPSHRGHQNRGSNGRRNGPGRARLGRPTTAPGGGTIPSGVTIPQGFPPGGGNGNGNGPTGTEYGDTVARVLSKLVG